jgi:glycosyltransferase involved in cell wall biosynthesis
MKILFLARALSYGGAERQLVELARGLHGRGHDVGVAVLYAGAPLEAELRAAGVRVHDLRKRSRWDLARFLARLWVLLRRERPDVLHGYLTVPNLLVALARPALPGAAIVWGLRASNVDLDEYDWLARMTDRATRRLSAVPDLIVVNSRAGLAHHIGSGVPEGRTVAIENGIDTRRFAPDPAARAAVRARWHVAGSERLVGLVGRLDPMKDHATFLGAAAKVAQGRADARFVCVGDGPAEYAVELQRQAEQLGLSDRLRWSAATGNPTEIYNALDVAVSASAFGEGFSNVIAEAMACGVPCVATDVGDSVRLVGTLGRSVKPRDPEALGSAILDVLQDLDAGRVDHLAVRKHIIDNFSIERLVTRTEDALARVLAERAARSGASRAAR